MKLTLFSILDYNNGCRLRISNEASLIVGYGRDIRTPTNNGACPIALETDTSLFGLLFFLRYRALLGNSERVQYSKKTICILMKKSDCPQFH
ncbi:MAG: hypothetical protein LBT50_00080 [Prevotellaceae bacterium]|nr:hypothetical protein [Prevotellaceae bacterium]